MGMYDVINGFQVKCFTIPLYYGRGIFGLEEFKDYGLGFSGGTLRSYHIGDTVPFKTWWYDYTPDFNVIDVDGEDIVHKIRKGKIEDVKKGNLEEEDFEGINLCVGYHGTMLHIKDFQEYNQFLKNIQEFRDFYEYNKAWAGAYREGSKKATKADLAEAVKQREYLNKVMEPYKKAVIDPYIYTTEEAMKKESVFGGLLECMRFHMDSLPEKRKEDTEIHRESLIGCLDDYERLCKNAEYPLKEYFSEWSNMPIGEINEILEKAARTIESLS